MTFKFSFAIDGEPAQAAAPDAVQAPSADVAPAVEVAIPAGAAEVPEALQEVELAPDASFVLRSVSSHTASRLLEGLGTSDLLPGQYEGGLKLWESAVDLARFLLERYPLRADASGGSMAGVRVIELGCGHGLPGIVCALAGAEACFQDYNAEVLTMLAAPNLKLNAGLRQMETAATRYFAGDWTLLGPLLQALGLANSFDLVVSAETIYSESSTMALLACIKQCLKPGGVAYIAAKTMYFGLDGGTFPFRQLVGRDPQATLRQVATVAEGVAREILELRLGPSARDLCAAEEAVQ